MQRLIVFTLSAFLAATASGAQAKDLKWGPAPPGLPAGAQLAVVKGDPGKAGEFIIRIKMPADYAVPPHHHPTDEVVRVKSGTLNYGMGDMLDKSNAGTLSDPMTHVTMQAGMNHWVFTTAPAEVQVSGTGPFQIVYVNPKDDPRNAGK